MSLEKDDLTPLRKELLRRLGFDYTPDFIFHYQEVIDAMLEHCPIRFAYEVCIKAKMQYDVHHKSLLQASSFKSIQDLIDEDDFDLDDSDLDTSELSLPAESEILNALSYCCEDPDREAFELLLKRTNELSVDMQVFGQLISEVNQAQEDSSFWNNVRMELLFRKVNEMDLSEGKVRIARLVHGPHNERNYEYLGTQEQYEEFEIYRRRLAESWAFALAEWIDIYRPFHDFIL